MSTSTNPLFIVCLVIAVLAAPVLASTSQDAIGVINGDNNKQVVGNEVNIGKQYVDEDINAPSFTYVNVEAPKDYVPNVLHLDVGTAETSTQLLGAGEVLAVPTADNVTFTIRSPTPLGIYLITTGNDKLLLADDRSVIDFNRVYHRPIHGIISPYWIFPRPTTLISITTHANGYLVIDNRYYPADAMIEIQGPENLIYPTS
jgi:hypothetical protein